MSEFRKFSPTRQVVKLDDLSPHFGDNVVICVPYSSWLIARKLLSTRGQWPTSYVVDYVGDIGYNIPDDSNTHYKQVLTDIAEFLAASDMSCDLTVGLQNIVDAIDRLSSIQSSCCTGYGASGAGNYESAETGFTDNGVDNYPENFSDRDSYTNYKCAAVNYALDLLLIDLKWIQNTDATLVTASILAASLVTPIPFDDVAALAIVILQQALEATLDTILGELIDAIEDNRDDIACQLYNSVNEADFITTFENWISSKVDAVSASFLGYFLNNDIANWAFGKVSSVVTSLVGNWDCSSCVAATYDVLIGTEIAPRLIDATYSANQYWVSVEFSSEVELTYLQTSTTITTENNQGYRLFNGAGTLLYASNTPPTLPYSGVGSFVLIDRLPPNDFTVEFSYD